MNVIDKLNAARKKKGLPPMNIVGTEDSDSVSTPSASNATTDKLNALRAKKGLPPLWTDVASQDANKIISRSYNIRNPYQSPRQSPGQRPTQPTQPTQPAQSSASFRNPYNTPEMRTPRMIGPQLPTKAESERMQIDRHLNRSTSERLREGGHNIMSSPAIQKTSDFLLGGAGEIFGAAIGWSVDIAKNLKNVKNANDAKKVISSAFDRADRYANKGREIAGNVPGAIAAFPFLAGATATDVAHIMSTTDGEERTARLNNYASDRLSEHVPHMSKQQAENWLATGNLEGDISKIDNKEIAKAWFSVLTNTALDMYMIGQIATGSVRNYFLRNPNKGWTPKKLVTIENGVKEEITKMGRSVSPAPQIPGRLEAVKAVPTAERYAFSQPLTRPQGTIRTSYTPPVDRVGGARMGVMNQPQGSVARATPQVSQAAQSSQAAQMTPALASGGRLAITQGTGKTEVSPVYDPRTEFVILDEKKTKTIQSTIKKLGAIIKEKEYQLEKANRASNVDGPAASQISATIKTLNETRDNLLGDLDKLRASQIKVSGPIRTESPQRGIVPTQEVKESPTQAVKEPTTPVAKRPTTPVVREAPAESKPSDPRKYKSPEEYVKAQPKLYHATDAKFDEFNYSLNPDEGVTWFSRDKSLIETPEFPIIMERVLKPGKKLMPEDDFPKIENSDEYLDSELSIGDFMKSKGYAGIESSDGVVQLFDPNADTLTKSQLTDIWKKANKAEAPKATPAKAEPAKPAPVKAVQAKPAPARAVPAKAKPVIREGKNYSEYRAETIKRTGDPVANAIDKSRDIKINKIEDGSPLNSRILADALSKIESKIAQFNQSLRNMAEGEPKKIIREQLENLKKEAQDIRAKILHNMIAESLSNRVNKGEITKAQANELFDGRDKIKTIGELSDKINNLDKPTRMAKEVEPTSKTGIISTAGLEADYKLGKGEDYFVDLVNKKNAESLSKNDKKVDKEADIVMKFYDTKFQFSKRKGISPDKMEERAPASKEELSLSREIVSTLRKYGTKGLSTRHLPKGAAGMSDFAGTVRIRSTNDIGTAVHEGTHTILGKSDILDEIFINNPSEQFFQEMSQFLSENKFSGDSKMSAPLLMSEGLGRFTQAYIEAPIAMSERYPTLVGSLLKKGGRYYNEDLNNFLSEMNELVVKYQSLDDVNKVSSRIVKSPIEVDRRKYLKKLERPQAVMADFLLVLKKLTKEAGFTGTEYDAYEWAQHAYRTSHSIIQLNSQPKKAKKVKDPDSPTGTKSVKRKTISPIKSTIDRNHGYWTYTPQGEFKKLFDFNPGSIVDDIDNAGLSDLARPYYVARRTYFDYQRLDDLNRKYADLGREYNNIASKLSGLKGDERKKLVHTQREIGEEAVLVKEKADKLESVLSNDNISKDMATNIYKEHKDTFKPYDDKIDLINKARIQMRISSGELTPEFGKELIERKGYMPLFREEFDDIIGDEVLSEIRSTGLQINPTKLSPELRTRKGSDKPIIDPIYSFVAMEGPFQRRYIKRILNNRIVQLLETVEDPDAGRLVPYVEGIESKKGIIVGVNKDGIKKAWQVTEDFIKAFDILFNPRQLSGKPEKALVYSSQIFTKMTTGAYVFFAPVNFALLDLPAAFIQTQNKMVPVLDQLSTLSRIMFKDDKEAIQLVEKYILTGGHLQTFVHSYDIDDPKLFMDNLIAYTEKEGSALSRLTKLAGDGVDLVSAPSTYSELLMRAMEYVKSAKAGNSHITAMEHAANVSGSFYKKGSYYFSPYSLIRTSPYFNASIQAAMTFAHSLKTPEGRKRFAIYNTVMIGLVLAKWGALLALKEEDEEEYQAQLTNMIKGGEYERANKMQIGLMNEKGVTKNIRIPSHHAIVATTLNMMISEYMAKDIGVENLYNAGDYMDTYAELLPQQFNILDPSTAAVSALPHLPTSLLLSTLGYQQFPELKKAEPDFWKNIPSEERKNAYTAKWAIMLAETESAKKMNLGPARIEMMIRNTLGRSVDYAKMFDQEGNIKRAATGAFVSDYRPFPSAGHPYKDLNKEFETLGFEVKRIDEEFKGKRLPPEEKVVIDKHKLIGDLKSEMNIITLGNINKLEMDYGLNSELAKIALLINDGKTKEAEELFRKLRGNRDYGKYMQYLEKENKKIKDEK